MLDYDGTLVPLAPRPEQARPGQDLLRILEGLSARPGLKLAVISGRPLGDLYRLLPLSRAYLAASHGRFLSLPGTRDGEPRTVIRLGPAGPGREVWQSVRSLARAAAASVKGMWVEDKEEGIALHYREADAAQLDGALSAFSREVEPWLASGDLELLRGHKVLEVRIRGVHKGLAVEYLMGLYPQALPVYLGDDTTDEDAFRALKGRGPAVLVGPPRPSRASHRLPSPAAVKEFLTLLREAGRQPISVHQCQ
ncbi:MAG: trehalose-phosphatase [Thermoanaerobacteraceae bacterium]|nr:trehalose-phosphatase [Thermoanaerobacteraceae bacterium]